MSQYLFIIPMGVIYLILFFLIIPQIEGKTAKFIVIVMLIPVSYFLSTYVDDYLPMMFYRFGRFFSFR